MTPRNSDALLIDALRAGRAEAFERLYADYHAPIYNLCARIVGDREEAKDLTQDVFIAAFRDLPPAGKKQLKLRAWLYRVATNACLNHLRSRKNLGAGDPAILDAVPEQVDGFAQAETVALVEASLGQLNARYRTALVLKDLQGLPPEEIAEVMEVSRPNADVLVHRARGAFKVAFAKLAGPDATAPAALGLVLVPLSVPAALQAMPPLPVHLPPAHAPLHPGIPASAGPAGAGLLTKIGAALTTKAAIGAAAAAVVIGGGVVAVKEVERSHPVPAAAAASTPRGAVTSSPATYTGLHGGHWAGHETLMGEHGGAAHHAESAGHHAGEHSGSGSHDSATHDADDGGGSMTTTHDSTTSTSHTGDHATATTTTTHDAGGTTGGHDGGEMTGGHDGGD